MIRFVVLFCFFFFCHSLEDEREPKFFFGPKGQTVVSYRKVSQLVKEFVPSSCVVIESTLPPCRHVRNLEIYPTIPSRITKTQVPQIPNPSGVEAQNFKPQASETSHHVPTPPLRTRPQQVKYTSPYWNWNLFHFFRVPNVTFTSTKTEYVTTKVEDPNTVVSFYIKGCRPSKLPFNLPECEVAEPQPQQEEKNIVVMAPIKFVPSDSLISPSKIESEVHVEKETEKEEKQVEEVKEDEKKQAEN